MRNESHTNTSGDCSPGTSSTFGPRNGSGYCAVSWHQVEGNVTIIIIIITLFKSGWI